MPGSLAERLAADRLAAEQKSSLEAQQEIVRRQQEAAQKEQQQQERAAEGRRLATEVQKVQDQIQGIAELKVSELGAVIFSKDGSHINTKTNDENFGTSYRREVSVQVSSNKDLTYTDYEDTYEHHGKNGATTIESSTKVERTITPTETLKIVIHQDKDGAHVTVDGVSVDITNDRSLRDAIEDATYRKAINHSPYRPR